MKLPIIHIVMLLLFIIGLTLSCSNGNNNGNGTDSCIQTVDTDDALTAFEQCPTDGLLMFCNNYICKSFEGEMELTAEPILDVLIRPRECEQIDCFNMECEFEPFDDPDMTGIGTFTIEEILGNSGFNGTVTDQNEEEFIVQCSPIVP